MNIQKCINKVTRKYLSLLPFRYHLRYISRTSCVLLNQRIKLSSVQTELKTSIGDLCYPKFSTVSCPEADISTKFDELTFEQPVLHEELLALLSKCNTVSQQMEVLAETLALPPHDLQNRAKFCRVLEIFFKPFFKDFKIQIFGSTVNSFGFKGCDMDMTFDTSIEGNNEINYLDHPDIPLVSEVLSGKVTHQQLSELPVKDQLHFMHNVLLEYYKESIEAPIFINAHVPLLRFHFDKGNLKCDLTFENSVAYANTKLLYLFAKLDKRVVPLMMTLRYWAKHVELIGKGLMFNTYTISLLVVYFLQSRNPPILPSAEYIMSLSKSFEIKDMDDTSFLSILNEIPPNKNTETLEELLKDFFSFYLFFDFTRVICPLTAKAIPREEFFTPDRSKRFKMNTICVQDPMSLTHNVAELVDFKHCKKLSSELLKSCLMFEDSSATSPSSKPWGIMNIFDTPSQYLLRNVFKKREFSFQLPFVDDPSGSHPERAIRSADFILNILRDTLLFDCSTVDPKHVPELLRVQDEYVRRRKQEIDIVNAARVEIRRKTRRPDSSKSDESFNDDEPMVSMLEEFHKRNVDNDLLLVLECNTSKNSWLGRHTVESENLVSLNFWSRERAISERVSKQTSDVFAERVKSFTFLCEFYVPKNSNESAITLVFRPLKKLAFSPVLGVFLKQYLPVAIQHFKKS